MCVKERERESMCMSVCVGERERERVRVCACVCVHVCVSVRMFNVLFLNSNPTNGARDSFSVGFPFNQQATA